MQFFNGCDKVKTERDKTGVMSFFREFQCLANALNDLELAKIAEGLSNAAVVAYVNSSAEVKAHSDICCTSSNAVRIVESLEADEIIFVPDQNLGSYVQSQCPNKTIHLWKGFCPTHHQINADDVAKIKAEYPEAVLSQTHVIIGTEQGVVDTLKLRLPNIRFDILETQMVCKNMKKTTLNHIYAALSEGAGEITVDSTVAESAKKAIGSSKLEWWISTVP